MIRISTFAFLFMLLTPGLALADAYPEEWTSCKQDSDCVKSYACEDIALNRHYLDDFDKAFDEGCDGSSPTNPKAMARCVESQCELYIPEEKIEKK